MTLSIWVIFCIAVKQNWRRPCCWNVDMCSMLRIFFISLLLAGSVRAQEPPRESTAPADTDLALPKEIAPLAPVLPSGAPSAAPTPTPTKAPEPSVLFGYGNLWAHAGVNLGMAAAVTTPAFWTPSSDTGDSLLGVVQNDVAVALMPYAAFHPLYLGMAEETRLYCTEQSVTISNKSAQTLADYRAYEKGRMKWEAEARKAVDESWERLSQEERDRWARMATGWRPGDAGSCWLTWGGIFIGYPLTYKANLSTAADRDVTKDVIPLVAGGVSIAPVPYLNVLVGVHLYAASFKVDEIDAGGSAQDRRSHGLGILVAIGGNTDVFSKLLK